MHVLIQSTNNDDDSLHSPDMYSSFIDALKNFGSKKYTEDLQRIHFRCRSCSHLVWIARDMGIFTSFPACFKCQVQSLTQTIQRTANLIVENPLD